MPWIEYYQQALDLLGSGQDVEGSDFSFPPYIEIDVELDFDRDGIRDVQTSAAGWCGSRGCQVDIYVTRGRCGHHVGTIAGEPDTMQLQGESHLGLPDVVSLVREGAEKAILYRWQFDGTAYRCVSKRECQVGLGEDERGEECEPWQPPQPWSRCE